LTGRGLIPHERLFENNIEFPQGGIEKKKSRVSNFDNLVRGRDLMKFIIKIGYRYSAREETRAQKT